MARDGLPWFRIGCLSIIALPLLAVVVLVGVARLAGPGEAVARELVREIPAVNPDPGDLLSDAAPGLQTPGIPGRVKLDFTGVELFLKAAAAGSPITVQLEHDEASTELREFFEPGSGNGWVYEVRFHAASNSFAGLVSSMVGGAPKVVVSLPRETPMALELSLTQGGGRVDLGGLWLTTVELNTQQGGMELDVGEPLAKPLQRFESVGSMGGIKFASLGNASPRVMEITQRMGGFELDLRGQWQQDAEIDISVDMGGGALRVPTDVRVTGLADQEFDGQKGEGGDLPVLNIRRSVNMGEVEVIR